MEELQAGDRVKHETLGEGKIQLQKDLPEYLRAVDPVKGVARVKFDKEGTYKFEPVSLHLLSKVEPEPLAVPVEEEEGARVQCEEYFDIDTTTYRCDIAKGHSGGHQHFHDEDCGPYRGSVSELPKEESQSEPEVLSEETLEKWLAIDADDVGHWDIPAVLGRLIAEVRRLRVENEKTREAIQARRDECYQTAQEWANDKRRYDLMMRRVESFDQALSFFSGPPVIEQQEPTPKADYKPGDRIVRTNIRTADDHAPGINATLLELTQLGETVDMWLVFREDGKYEEWPTNVFAKWSPSSDGSSAQQEQGEEKEHAFFLPEGCDERLCSVCNKREESRFIPEFCEGDPRDRAGEDVEQDTPATLRERLLSAGSVENTTDMLSVDDAERIANEHFGTQS